MARFSWPVLGVALILDITAFGLALGAMAKRSKAKPTDAVPGYLTCEYTKDTATGLAALALVFLFFGHVLVTVVTSCMCFGKAVYNAGFSRVCAIFLFIFSWLTFIVSEIILLYGAVVNNIRTKGQVDIGVVGENENYCRQMKKAIFAAGAAFTFLTMVFSLLYYVFQAKAESKDNKLRSYRGGDDRYGEHNGPSINMTAYN
ncbi:uncharacterized protein [Physcomitrium patens]|uniref:Uncharacterized protein n=1 Tax=Physcomitrium patens TaxID=3218 RepID=A9SW36_PHYPA|nr:uncharacterized protein LOC112292969 [Physcomitrium patens]XP_024397734.1 uncharacterized protein LOC112292969 [Physcomitrium patens]XP_024397735.1 uncharacterized protein LOC112292969 [Physcomitrium patens]PNR37302.1 hypothetical protein PHYPA_020410 [Physcomitrium patens]|eukprot:XP_024397733.1 uncharacterized protein LOC112292969 [Physcomitrella patens]